MDAPGDPKLRELAFAAFKAIGLLGQPVSYEAVKDLNEFKELYGYIQLLDLTSRFGVTRNGNVVPGNAYDLWRLYIARAGAEMSSKGLLEESFSAVYPSLEESLYAEHATWLVWAPLNRFSSDLAGVAAPNGVEIREISEVERNYLQDLASRRMGAPLELTFGEYTHVLSRELETPKAGPMLGILEDEDFDAVMAALRLIKPGAVSYTFVVMTLVGPRYGPQFPIGQIGASWSSTRASAHGPEYRLQEQDQALLNDLVRKLARVSRPAVVTRSLDRFNFAYERTRSEDKIVDSWIGLEALFLGRDEQMELSYRASVRASRYLGNSPPEREWIYYATQRAYSARSRIVHGDPLPTGVHNIALFCQELLRLALRSAVLSGRPPQLKQLDISTVRAIPEEP